MNFLCNFSDLDYILPRLLVVQNHFISKIKTNLENFRSERAGKRNLFNDVTRFSLLLPSNPKKLPLLQVILDFLTFKDISHFYFLSPLTFEKSYIISLTKKQTWGTWVAQ